MSILTCETITPTKTGLRAKLSNGFRLQIDFTESWLARIAIIPDEGFTNDRTWMVAPHTNKNGDAPIEGRDRLSLEGFTLPTLTQTSVTQNDAIFETQNLRISIEQDPLRISTFQKTENGWQKILQDRENGAYQWLSSRQSFRHFQTKNNNERHYGLGDKTGPLDRTFKRVKCLQTDTMGYNAEKSDPLYKHAPFLIVSQPNAPTCGLLYDTFSEISFDLGAEHSNYFLPFRHVDTQEKGLVYWVIAGPKIKDVVPNLYKLTGMPAMPPRWSMGFAFTGMEHTDAEDAQNIILDFANTMREKNLPLSSIHLGSGYTQKKDKLRYVFNWNLEKFPDRKNFFKTLKTMGLHTCANVKPVLLTGHDSFKKAASQNWFVSRKDGTPAIERFWDGAGAQLDFTNYKTERFWREGITKQVLNTGFDSVWNDNNEAELWDETATLNGHNTPINAMHARPVHSFLMTRSSYHAILKSEPTKRPYTISRAGPIGIARYGETWSGDNYTNWNSLKWNLQQGLSMGLSGFPITGHDIGGFSGPSPSPQLLVRWFQMMALHPRAVMNSWKPDETISTTLPYMYEKVTDLVRSALELRYRFLPHIYSLTYQCHINGHPIIRPMFYDFNDEQCAQHQDAFMLGSNVLVAPAVDKGQRQHLIYLPKTQNCWFEFDTAIAHQGNQTIKVKASLEKLPIFVHAGAIIPLAKSYTINQPHEAQALEIALYPDMENGNSQHQIFWDNGDDIDLENNVVTFTLKWNESTVTITSNKKISIPIAFSCPTLNNRILKHDG